MRQTGTVSWFNNAISHGFITADDGKAVFMHFSVIQTKGVWTLEESQRVEFTVIQEPNGLEARNVVVLQENPARLETQIPTFRAAPVLF